MTSRRPFWCPKPIFRELNYFLMHFLICIDAGHVIENTLLYEKKVLALILISFIQTISQFLSGLNPPATSIQLT